MAMGEVRAWRSWKGVQTWRKLPPLPIERPFTTTPDGFVSLMGRFDGIRE